MNEKEDGPSIGPGGTPWEMGRWSMTKEKWELLSEILEDLLDKYEENQFEAELKTPFLKFILEIKV